MASTCRRTASTPPEPCERHERALDCLRDCVRRRRPRGPGALPAWSFARNATATRSIDGWRRAPAAEPSASVEVLRQERGLANFDHPRLAGLNEFLAQTGLRISMASAWTVDGVALRGGRVGAVAVSVPSVDGRGDRLDRRLAGHRRLSSDRSPTADRQLHRPAAGRAQHHRAQLAHRPPVRERDWAGVQGNARPDRRPSSP